jgi:hypothetical protein
LYGNKLSIEVISSAEKPTRHLSPQNLLLLVSPAKVHPSPGLRHPPESFHRIAFRRKTATRHHRKSSAISLAEFPPVTATLQSLGFLIGKYSQL